MLRGPNSLRMTQKFQIGSDKDMYIFGPAYMEANQSPVYVCSRGLQQEQSHKKDRKVLWLARGKKGRWYVRQAPENSKQPLKEGPSVLRTKLAFGNIAMEGEFEWQYYDSEENTWVDIPYPLQTNTWIEFK